MRALPPVARTVVSDPDPYVYPRRVHPRMARPAGAGRPCLQKAGWSKGSAWRNLSGGIVALHAATR